jgi:CRP-like cAMP-binding protein
MQSAEVHSIVPTSGRRSLSLAAHDEVYMEDTEAGSLFSIVFGCIGLSKLCSDGRRQIVELLGPGDVFGFTMTTLHETTAIALDHTRLIMYAREQLQMEPVIRISMLEHMSAQICSMHALSLALGRKTARERVATFLLMMAERFSIGSAAEPNTATVGLSLSRQETADLLGLSQETISREFSCLRRFGVLSYSHGGPIRINRLSSLRRLSGDGAEGI